MVSWRRNAREAGKQPPSQQVKCEQGSRKWSLLPRCCYCRDLPALGIWKQKEAPVFPSQGRNNWYERTAEFINKSTRLSKVKQNKPCWKITIALHLLYPPKCSEGSSSSPRKLWSLGLFLLSLGLQKMMPASLSLASVLNYCSEDPHWQCLADFEHLDAVLQGLEIKEDNSVQHKYRQESFEPIFIPSIFLQNRISLSRPWLTSKKLNRVNLARVWMDGHQEIWCRVTWKLKNSNLETRQWQTILFVGKITWVWPRAKLGTKVDLICLSMLKECIINKKTAWLKFTQSITIMASMKQNWLCSYTISA